MEIYIVEDDMSVISVLQDIIEDNDLGIICGTSEGQPADVDDILAKNPDMVLIDFLMPEKDGVQVMRELRERGCKAKCIMISQVAAKELIGKAYDAGIEFFISKPINIIEVKSVIRNVDEPGRIMEVAAALSKAEINVATMQVFRDKRGGTAVMVVETDQVIPQSAIDELESKPGIIRVKFLDPNGSV